MSTQTIILMSIIPDILLFLSNLVLIVAIILLIHIIHSKSKKIYNLTGIQQEAKIKAIENNQEIFNAEREIEALRKNVKELMDKNR